MNFLGLLFIVVRSCREKRDLSRAVGRCNLSLQWWIYFFAKMWGFSPIVRLLLQRIDSRWVHPITTAWTKKKRARRCLSLVAKRLQRYSRNAGLWLLFATYFFKSFGEIRSPLYQGRKVVWWVHVVFFESSLILGRKCIMRQMRSVLVYSHFPHYGCSALSEKWPQAQGVWVRL